MFMRTGRILSCRSTLAARPDVHRSSVMLTLDISRVFQDDVSSGSTSALATRMNEYAVLKTSS